MIRGLECQTFKSGYDSYDRGRGEITLLARIIFNFASECISGDTSDSMLSVTWYSISTLLCYIT